MGVLRVAIKNEVKYAYYMYTLTDCDNQLILGT